MERCVRCKNDLGFGSVVVVSAKGEKVSMVHFFCAKPEEVRALYGNETNQPLVLPMGDPNKEE